MDRVERHLAALTGEVPGDYVPLLVGGAAVGFVRPAVADRLGRTGAAVVLADAGALAAAQAVLVAAGVVRLRGEDFDVRARADGPVLARVDRGALPVFGIEAQGVHVNGLVGERLWVGRRSAGRAMDAGKLDHLVAGGIAAGMDAAGTLVKEAWEEAGVPEALARQARFVGTVAYCVVRAEGLRRDRLHCYDLDVPEGFVPVPRDGEVEAFTLMRLDDVLAAVRDGDDYKFNVNLVLIDLFARRGMIAGSAALERLRRGSQKHWGR